MRIAINISTDFYNKKRKVVCMEEAELLSKVDVKYDNNYDERLFLMESHIPYRPILNNHI